MRDDDQQLIDELLLRLLVEEGAARDCAARAEMMAQDGSENAADIMLHLSRRHAAETMSLRAKLAMVHFQDNIPAEHNADTGVIRLRPEEPAPMTFDELRERLAGLLLGDVVLLSEGEFDQVFTQAADREGNRWAAVELAEKNGCRLMFREGREPYAVFMRRQRLSEVVSSPRVRAVGCGLTPSPRRVHASFYIPSQGQGTSDGAARGVRESGGGVASCSA